MFSLYGMAGVGAYNNPTLSDAENRERDNIVNAVAGLSPERRIAALIAMESRNYQKAWSIIYDRSSANLPTAQPTQNDLSYSPFVTGGTPDITRPSPGATDPQYVTTPGDIPGMINSIGNVIGKVLNPNQQASLEAQLARAQRSGLPVYLPSSGWGTAALIAGAIALVAVGVVFYRRKAS